MISRAVRDGSCKTLLLGMLVSAAVSGCSTTSPSTTSSRPPARADAAELIPLGSRAANTALQQVGVPYVYGGNTPRGFDCSGLVQYSYAKAGLQVPRTTGQLWQAAAPVDAQELRRGDLLFFKIEGKMSHVGLYLGGQRFVHAPSSGKTVTVATLDSPYYSRALLRAGRLYEDP